MTPRCGYVRQDAGFRDLGPCVRDEDHNGNHEESDGGQHRHTIPSPYISDADLEKILDTEHNQEGSGM